MYIIKNALRSISRNKGRNILIGIIIFVIATATCIALSIMQAAQTAKQGSLNLMNITAQITHDRQKQLENFNPNSQTGNDNNQQPSQIDKNTMKDMLIGNSLSLDDMLIYAKAESVKEFYYTASTSLNGLSDFEPISTSNSNNTVNSNNMTGFQPSKNSSEKMINQGDFTLIGYSSDLAMTDFISGTCKITSGEMFEQATENFDCIISDELAVLNSLNVGDIIKLVNPNNESEVFELSIKGIYNNSASTTTQTGSKGFFMQDPANEILISYNALNKMKNSSDTLNATNQNNTEESTISAISIQTTGTYVFENVEKYEAFEVQAKALGLSDDYTITSQDINSFEQSLLPLENLSKFAFYFLIVVLAIGAIILVVLNIFNVRERKYEIGVLTAIGMNKIKVSIQLISELFVVTLIAIIIGSGIGALSSVPVANVLLESQIASNQQSAQNVENQFGRPTGTSKGDNIQIPTQEQDKFNHSSQINPENSITEISSATNFIVISQLMAIGILLTLISSLSAIIFVMRYEPLKILTNRD